MRAVVRRPSPRIADGEVTHIDREPMNTALAFEQHGAYVALLSDLGCELVWAPEIADHPDGLFVEDALVVIGNHALLTRPGAPSRVGEVDSMVALVEELGLVARRVVAPGTIDGGDVLVTDRHVFVGRSTRTNDHGIEQLAAFAAQTGRATVSVEVHGCLHLKTAITALPDGALIAVAEFVTPEIFERYGYVVRRAPERSGGDVLFTNGTVVLPGNAPLTAALLRAQGYGVREIDVSELQKIEAGVTCMSVLAP